MPGIKEVLPGIAPLVHMVQAQLLARTGARHWHKILHDLPEDLGVHKPAVDGQVRRTLVGVGELLGSPDLRLGPRWDTGFAEIRIAIAPGGAPGSAVVHAATTLNQRLLAVGRQHTTVYSKLPRASGLAQALFHPYTPHVRVRRELEAHPGPGAHVPVTVQAVGLPGGHGVVVEDVVQGEVPRVRPTVAAARGGEGGRGDLQWVARADLAARCWVGFHGPEKAHILDLPAKLQGLRVVHQNKLLPRSVILLHALNLGRGLAVQFLVQRGAPAGEATGGVGADSTILGELTGVHPLSTLVHVRRPHKIRVGEVRDHRPPVRVLRVLRRGLHHRRGEGVIAVRAHEAAVGGAVGGGADEGQGAGIKAEDVEDAGVVGVEAQGSRRRRPRHDRPHRIGSCSIRKLQKHSPVGAGPACVLAGVFTPGRRLRALARAGPFAPRTCGTLGGGISIHESLHPQHVCDPRPEPSRARVGATEVEHGPVCCRGTDGGHDTGDATADLVQPEARGRVRAVQIHCKIQLRQVPDGVGSPGGHDSLGPLHRPIRVRVTVDVERVVIVGVAPHTLRRVPVRPRQQVHQALHVAGLADALSRAPGPLEPEGHHVGARDGDRDLTVGAVDATHRLLADNRSTVRHTRDGTCRGTHHRDTGGVGCGAKPGVHDRQGPAVYTDRGCDATLSNPVNNQIISPHESAKSNLYSEVWVRRHYRTGGRTRHGADLGSHCDGGRGVDGQLDDPGWQLDIPCSAVEVTRQQGVDVAGHPGPRDTWPGGHARRGAGVAAPGGGGRWGLRRVVDAAVRVHKVREAVRCTITNSDIDLPARGVHASACLEFQQRRAVLVDHAGGEGHPAVRDARGHSLVGVFPSNHGPRDRAATVGHPVVLADQKRHADSQGLRVSVRHAVRPVDPLVEVPRIHPHEPRGRRSHAMLSTPLRRTVGPAPIGVEHEVPVADVAA
mmetsp:Transcript_54462/g.124952  ORF Transcript_54462/g.124952 Transcript_54462/m.124952 type:complete len:947 (-) Transcript_54462:1229-4069(-)